MKDKPSIKHSKFFKLLLHLNKIQLEDLAVFIHLPSQKPKQEAYTNTFSDLIQQLQQANKKNKTFTEEIFTQSLSPTQQGKWRDMKVVFTKIITQYITSLSKEEDNIFSSYILLEHLLYNNLETHYNSLYKQTQKTLKNKRTAKDKLVSYLLIKLKAQQEKNNRKKNFNHIPDLTKSLDDFYILERLQLCCENISRQIVKGESIEDLGFPFDSTYIYTLDNKIIHIYYELYQLFLHDVNYSKYKQLADEVFKHTNLLKEDNTLKGIHHLLMNYCIIGINMGSQSFAKSYYQHLTFLEKEQLLLDHQQLDYHHFNNYVAISLINERYDWLHNFIDNYKMYLPEAKRENATQLALARLYFYIGKMEKSYDILHSLKASDKLYHIAREKLYLKLYATQQNSLLKNTAQKLKKYIQRNIDPTHLTRPSLLKFITYIDRFNDLDSNDLPALKKDLGLLDYLWFKKVIEKRM